MTCYFTTNIADILECSEVNDFDFNGFPNKPCDKYPCDKFKEVDRKIAEFETITGGQNENL